MTAALGCFDMERHERDLAVTFSITFQFRNRNSPFAAIPCNRLPPTRITLPALLPPLPQPARIHPLGATPQGPLHPPRSQLPQPLLSTRPSMLFSLYLGCQKFIRWDQGWVGGQTGLGYMLQEDEKRGSSCSSLVRLRKASLASRAVVFMFNVSGNVVFELRATNYRKSGPCLHLTATWFPHSSQLLTRTPTDTSSSCKQYKNIQCTYSRRFSILPLLNS